MQGVSAANKRREEIFDLSVKACEPDIKIIDEQGDQMGSSAKLVTGDGSIPYSYSLMSDWTTHIS